MGSCNGVFRQLDRKSGAVRWETKVRGEAAGKYYFHGDVLITTKLVFAAADAESGSGMEGGVHAFDTSTGQELWKHPAGRGVLAKIVGREPRVFASTISGEFVCLDMDSGKRLWNQSLEASAWECAAVRGQQVFVASRDGSVYSLNADSGAVEWRTNIGSRVTTSIEERGGSLYAGTQEGLIHRIDMRNGKVISSIKADTKLKPTSLPVIGNNALIVLLTDETHDYRALVSVDLDLRKVRWRQEATDKWTTSRIFLIGTTAVLGRGGEVTGYNMATGEPTWSANVAGTIRSIGGFGDAIYVGTTEGFLYAVQVPGMK